MIKLIAAVGPNNLIGSGDKLPWHLPSEFKHFKETTLNHSLLFGKTTYLGIGKNLPNRETIVLSSKGVVGPDRVIRNETELNELFEEFKDSEKILFIAGGKQVYEKFYKWAEELIISEVETSSKGDVYLEIDLSDYKLVDEKQMDGFKVKHYKR